MKIYLAIHEDYQVVQIENPNGSKAHWHGRFGARFIELDVDFESLPEFKPEYKAVFGKGLVSVCNQCSASKEL